MQWVGIKDVRDFAREKITKNENILTAGFLEF